MNWLTPGFSHFIHDDAGCPEFARIFEDPDVLASS
jgi:hypothetical protein